ncbi:MAG: hypothetical protein COB04_15080 [Gammaproteobacteria bacterium]|nr:MAG: hypothetical protein COB04_15080 [Gammaproteobacteria bacterium]
MVNYIKGHIGIISLVVISFVIGVAGGVTTQENEKGIYISINYPDGARFLTLGKNIQTVNGLDFDELPANQVVDFISKIKALDAESDFGSKVRELANNGSGPFAPISINLDVHLVVDDPYVKGPVAKVCLNSKILGNALVAYEWADANNVPKRVLMDIHPVRKEQSCNTTDSNRYSLWLDRGYAENELGILAGNGETLSIKANMIVSILSI